MNSVQEKCVEKKRKKNYNVWALSLVVLYNWRKIGASSDLELKITIICKFANI